MYVSNLHLIHPHAALHFLPPPFIRGCLLAVVSGLLYGSSYTPVLYIKSQSSCRDSMFHGASLYGTASAMPELPSVKACNLLTITPGLYPTSDTLSTILHSNTRLLKSNMIWVVAPFSPLLLQVQVVYFGEI